MSHTTAQVPWTDRRSFEEHTREGLALYTYMTTPSANPALGLPYRSDCDQRRPLVELSSQVANPQAPTPFEVISQT